MTVQGAVFVDRDNTILRNAYPRSKYLLSWDAARWVRGAKAGLVELAKLGRPVILVTNQAGVADGRPDVGQLEAIHEILRRKVMLLGGRLDAIYFCPHARAWGCDCRKPRPGLFHQAAAFDGIDLSASVMIGDSATDLLAAYSAGLRAFVHVATGPRPRLGLPSGTVRFEEKIAPGRAPELGPIQVDLTRDLLQAARHLREGWAG